MKVQHLSRFNFGLAVYHLRDVKGNAFTLQVDYLHNSFEVLPEPQTPLPQALLEAADIAQDLLKRKRHKNFAEPT